jgi:long-chain acyl-CoA synthetase
MAPSTEEQIARLESYFHHPKNLVDLFEDSVKKWGGRNLFGTKNPDTRQYEWVTYEAVARRVDLLRGALAKLGLKKGESVGVIVSNSVEWFVIENATHGLGGRYVPMYEKELEKTWHYIVQDGEVKYLFVRDEKIYHRVIGFKKEIPSLQEIFIIYGRGENSLGALEKMGGQNPVPSYKPHWSEPAEIIYTSGTTGDPKGVLLSHGNLTHCSQSGYKIYPHLNANSVSLSILPWAHSYALSAELHNFIQFGGSMGIMESVETIGDDLLAVRPTYLIAVPRVFNKIYAGIQSKMREEKGLKKKLFDASCDEAVKCRDRGRKSLKLKMLDKLVFSKIRARFGGRLEGIMTASAIMNPEIARFFKDIGLPTFDCYGLTETSPAITMNSPLLGNKYGTVGKPVMDMHVVIDQSFTGPESPDGEILVYGAHIMMGYHNKPEQTAAVMTPDTWNGFPGIRTGDLGRIDEEGYLIITGRFKDEYKLSNGKYIHPESIEQDIKLIHYIANAFVCGEGREYNVCVLIPDFAAVKADPSCSEWAHLTPAEMVAEHSFKEFLKNEVIAQLRKAYGGYEIPKKFLIISDDFSLENGLLTQTMKLKRRQVMKRFGDDLSKLYD